MGKLYMLHTIYWDSQLQWFDLAISPCFFALLHSLLLQDYYQGIYPNYSRSSIDWKVSSGNFGVRKRSVFSFRPVTFQGAHFRELTELKDSFSKFRKNSHKINVILKKFKIRFFKSRKGSLLQLVIYNWPARFILFVEEGSCALECIPVRHQNLRRYMLAS